MNEISAVSTDRTELATRALSSPDIFGRKSDGASAVEMSMSFGDFIDMINPLEHIPVISSLYRAFTDEEISPVSRIAGDALYGGIGGLASAGISAAGTIGDEIVAAMNDGSSATETVVAALFGKETETTTRLAEAATPTTAPTTTQTSLQVASVSDTSAQSPLLDRVKLPYGGVMDTATAATAQAATDQTATAQSNQNIAATLNARQNALQAQKTLRNSRFATAQPASASLASSATPTLSSATPLPTEEPLPSSTLAKVTTPMEPETEKAMRNLLQELQGMKGIKLYKNAADAAPSSGENVNIVN